MCPSNRLELELTTNDPLVVRPNDEMISLLATSESDVLPLILFAGTKNGTIIRVSHCIPCSIVASLY